MALNYFAHPFFNHKMFDTKFFCENDFFKLPYFSGIGEGCGGTSVPHVTKSEITSANKAVIQVTWDREMDTSGDIAPQVHVLADEVEWHSPDSVTITSSEKTLMLITMPTQFTAGESVSWSFDDTGAEDLFELGEPLHEATSVEHSVINNL